MFEYHPFRLATSSDWSSVSISWNL